MERTPGQFRRQPDHWSGSADGGRGHRQRRFYLGGGPRPHPPAEVPCPAGEQGGTGGVTGVRPHPDGQPSSGHLLKTLDHRYQAANLMWAQYNPARPTWKNPSLNHLLGHTDRELFEPERATEFEQTDDVVIATGRSWERDYDEIHGDSHIQLHVVKMPVFDIRGSVASVAGIGFDITEM